MGESRWWTTEEEDRLYACLDWCLAYGLKFEEVNRTILQRYTERNLTASTLRNKLRNMIFSQCSDKGSYKSTYSEVLVLGTGIMNLEQGRPSRIKSWFPTFDNDHGWMKRSGLRPGSPLTKGKPQDVPRLVQNVPQISYNEDHEVNGTDGLGDRRTLFVGAGTVAAADSSNDESTSQSTPHTPETQQQQPPSPVEHSMKTVSSAPRPGCFNNPSTVASPSNRINETPVPLPVAGSGNAAQMRLSSLSRPSSIKYDEAAPVRRRAQSRGGISKSTSSPKSLRKFSSPTASTSKQLMHTPNHTKATTSTSLSGLSLASLGTNQGLHLLSSPEIAVNTNPTITAAAPINNCVHIGAGPANISTEEWESIRSYYETQLQEKVSQYKARQQASDTAYAALKTSYTRLSHYSLDKLPQNKSTTISDFKTLTSEISDLGLLLCKLGQDTGQHPSRLLSLCTRDAPLIERGAQLVSGHDLQRLQSLCCKTNIPESDLLAALITGVIFDMVLEPVVSSLFTPLHPETENYRSLILQDCGQHSLKRMDFIQFKNFTDSHFFQKGVLPAKVNQLRCTIIDNLKLLLAGGPAQDSFRHESAYSQAEQDVICKLDQVLSQALDLKIVLSQYITGFEFHFFKSGERVDLAYMDSDSRFSPQADPALIKLCLSPAMFHANDTGSDGTSYNILSPNAPLPFDRVVSTTVQGEFVTLARAVKAKVIV